MSICRHASILKRLLIKVWRVSPWDNCLWPSCVWTKAKDCYCLLLLLVVIASVCDHWPLSCMSFQGSWLQTAAIINKAIISYDPPSLVYIYYLLPSKHEKMLLVVYHSSSVVSSCLKRGGEEEGAVKKKKKKKRKKEKEKRKQLAALDSSQSAVWFLFSISEGLNHRVVLIPGNREGR